MTEWDIGSWYWQLDFPVGKHHKVTMSAHCYKLEEVGGEIVKLVKALGW